MKIKYPLHISKVGYEEMNKNETRKTENYGATSRNSNVP